MGPQKDTPLAHKQQLLLVTHDSPLAGTYWPRPRARKLKARQAGRQTMELEERETLTRLHELVFARANEHCTSRLASRRLRE